MSDDLGSEISTPRPPAIFAAIAAVMSERVWVGKNKKAETGGPSYQFRGIDDVIAYLQPVMAKHGISVVQRVTHVERDGYSRGDGKSPMVSARLTVDHQFTCAKDGSRVICTTIGEANDTSDKASNKCLSAALKYALVHTFMIPTYEPERDTEESHHEAPAKETAPTKQPAHPAKPTATEKKGAVAGVSAQAGRDMVKLQKALLTAYPGEAGQAQRHAWLVANKCGEPGKLFCNFVAWESDDRLATIAEAKALDEPGWMKEDVAAAPKTTEAT